MGAQLQTASDMRCGNDPLLVQLAEKFLADAWPQAGEGDGDGDLTPNLNLVSFRRVRHRWAQVSQAEQVWQLASLLARRQAHIHAWNGPPLPVVRGQIILPCHQAPPLPASRANPTDNQDLP